MDEAMPGGLVHLLKNARVLVTIAQPEKTMESALESVAGYELEEGNSLKEMLGEEEFEIVDERIPHLAGILLDRLEPMYSLEQLVLWDAVSSARSKSESSIEIELKTIADKLGKEIVELEGESKSLLGVLTREEAIEGIRQYIARPEEVKSRIEKEIEAALNSCRPGGIEENVEEKRTAGTDDWLLQRVEEASEKSNRSWVRKIVPLLEEGDAFVAVGLSQLQGHDGLVALLEKKGFEVSRMTVPSGELEERDAPSEKYERESDKEKPEKRSRETEEALKKYPKAHVQALLGILHVTARSMLCDSNTYASRCFEIRSRNMCRERAKNVLDSCAEIHTRRLPEVFDLSLAMELEPVILRCAILSYLYLAYMDGLFIGGESCEEIGDLAPKEL